MERINAQTIFAKLAETSQKYINDVISFDELDSTNSWLLESKQCNTVCVAEKQLRGRGRRGNSWSSPDDGNIYLSLSWCFDEVPVNLSLISLITGISLCESLSAHSLQGHGLKWPNDIYINEQKLAGILVETADNLQRVIIGIGLNIYNQDELGWCGLKDVLDDVPERNTLITSIVDGLVAKLLVLEQLSFAEFYNQWKQWDIVLDREVLILQSPQRGKSHPRGKSLQQGKSQQQIKGIARGVDEKGQIKVEMGNGDIQYFHSAEISLRW